MKLLDKDGLTYYTGKIKNELTDYVKNTDYATSSTGGVIKLDNTYYGTDLAGGKLYCTPLNYSIYQSKGNSYFISKGTLENVITGKQLTDKTYVDNIVGDIDTILETLTTGTGV